MFTQKLFFVFLISSICGQQIPDIEIVVKNPNSHLSNQSHDSFARLKRSDGSPRVQRLANYGPSESQEQDGEAVTSSPGTNRRTGTHHITVDGHKTTIEVEEFDNGYKSSRDRQHSVHPSGLGSNQFLPRLVDSRRGQPSHSRGSYGEDEAEEVTTHHITSTRHPSGVQTSTVHSTTTRPFHFLRPSTSASTTTHPDIEFGSGYTSQPTRAPKLHPTIVSTHSTPHGFLTTTIHPGLHHALPVSHGVSVPSGANVHPQLSNTLVPGNLTNHGSYIFSVQTSGLAGNISVPHPQINIVFTGFSPLHQPPQQPAKGPSSHAYPEEHFDNSVHPSLHQRAPLLHQSSPPVQHTNISIVHPKSNTSIHITTSHPLNNTPTTPHPPSTQHVNLYSPSYSTNAPHTTIHSLSYTATQHPISHSITHTSTQHPSSLIHSTSSPPTHTVSYHPTSTPQTVVIHTSTHPATLHPNLYSMSQVSSHPSLLHSTPSPQVHVVTNHPLMPTRTPPTVVVHSSTHPAPLHQHQAMANPITTSVTSTNDGHVHISSSSSTSTPSPSATTIHTGTGSSITIHHPKNDLKPQAEDFGEISYRQSAPAHGHSYDEAERSYQKTLAQQQHPSTHIVSTTPHSTVSTTIHNTPSGHVAVHTTSTPSSLVTHRRRPPTRVSYPVDEDDNRLRFRLRAKASTSSAPSFIVFKDDSDEILHPTTPPRSLPRFSDVQPDAANLLIRNEQETGVNQSESATNRSRERNNHRRDDLEHLAHLEHSKNKINVRPSTFSEQIDSLKENEFNNLPSDVGNKHVNLAQNFPDRKIPYPVVTKTKTGKTERVQV